MHVWMRKRFHRLLLVQRFEDVAFVVLDLEFLEELEIFLAERLACMVSHLVSNIIDYAFQLRVAILKCAEALLPTESAHHPSVLVDMVGRAGLDVPNQI